MPAVIQSFRLRQPSLIFKAKPNRDKQETHNKILQKVKPADLRV
jgi:hypothetical protein